MKLYARDKITALLGIGVLIVIAAASYYYALKTDLLVTKTIANRESPEFTTHDIVITTFNPDGTAKERVFADYAEHFSDGRSTSIKPRYVTLAVDKPQIRASSNTGSSMDDGESVLFSGDVIITRAGDEKQAPVRVTTTQATVYPDTSRVLTDAPVRIENGSNMMSGIGLTLDNVERTMHLHSNVLTITLPKKFGPKGKKSK